MKHNQLPLLYGVVYVVSQPTREC